MIQTTLLPLDKLEQNTGQIEGLPRNPRTWTLSEINRIAASLKETPELFEARPILVLPKNGKYVIIGGNLRYEGCRKNQDKEVPCFVLPEDTPLEKLKELVIKDNGSFGAWDYDALANEWDNGRLPDWGVPVWSMNDTELELPQMSTETSAAKGTSETGYSSITFVFKKEDAELVNEWIEKNTKQELTDKIVELCQPLEVK